MLNAGHLIGVGLLIGLIIEFVLGMKLGLIIGLVIGRLIGLNLTGGLGEYVVLGIGVKEYDIESYQ